jgi:hypothetical protein
MFSRIAKSWAVCLNPSCLLGDFFARHQIKVPRISDKEFSGGTGLSISTLHLGREFETAHGFRPMESTPSHPSTGKLRTSTTSSVWRPLRGQTFRDLLIADIFSDVDTFMQSVGAAWLMVSLKAGPLYVALTQTALALP